MQHIHAQQNTQNEYKRRPVDFKKGGSQFCVRLGCLGGWELTLHPTQARIEHASQDQQTHQGHHGWGQTCEVRKHWDREHQQQSKEQDEILKLLKPRQTGA